MASELSTNNPGSINNFAETHPELTDGAALLSEWQAALVAHRGVLAGIVGSEDALHLFENDAKNKLELAMAGQESAGGVV